MSAARDALGREHFPTCRCFQDQSLGMDDTMYNLAEFLATAVHTNARLNGMCPQSSPYLLALLVHMVEARFAEDMAQSATPEEATEPIPGLMIRKMRELHPAVIERLTALMARSEKISLAGPGTGSVQ